MRGTISAWLATFLLCTHAVRAQPLGTAFTYQGELRTSGSPATGPHDLRFRLYDAAAGGTQLGAVICSDNVALNGGRFSVSLDFGSQFAGQQRFLEIEVRPDTGLSCANSAGFVTLSPRQALTGAPNAAFALNAGHATTATSATTAATATNANQLNGQSATFYQNAGNLTAGMIPDARLGGTYTGLFTLNNAGNTFNGSHTGSGAGLSALNATNMTTGTLGIARFPAGGSWLLTTSLDVDAATLFIDPTSDRVGIGTASPSRKLDVRSGDLASVYGETSNLAGDGVFGNASATTGTAWGVRGESASTSGIGVRGVAGASSGLTIGVHGGSFSPNGQGVRGVSEASSGYTVGVSGESSAFNPTGTGVVGKAQATGGYFLAEGTTGTGLFGVASSPTGTTFGVQGHTSSSHNGRGVFGWASATTGFSYGVLGQSDSSDGIGVMGVATAPFGSNAIGVKGTSAVGAGVYGSGSPGVYGVSALPSGTGVSGLGGRHGGYFRTGAADGSAVFAEATATSGATEGVFGRSDSASGTGVSAWSTASSGITYGVSSLCESTNGTGVRGWARAASGTTYGVWGQSSSASGWGVWAQGRSGASGTKSFRIDHPADPENKYLLHYSTESPEVLNAYRGTLTLDGAGQAVVELPPYFALVNKDPSYTLTAVGTPMPFLHVAEEISAEALAIGQPATGGQAVPTCSFRIAGGAPGAKVSWRVEAVRNDLWVRTRGAPVEADKEGLERGTYQHPELYGQLPERGLNYRHEQALPADTPATKPAPAPRSIGTSADPLASRR